MQKGIYSGNKDNSLDVISRGSILRRKEHEYKSRMGKRKKELNSGIPDDVMEGFAKALLSEIRGFYESEKGKAFFEKWKAEKEQNNKDVA